jgi:hypothetical protein
MVEAPSRRRQQARAGGATLQNYSIDPATPGPAVANGMLDRGHAVAERLARVHFGERHNHPQILNGLTLMNTCGSTNVRP